MLYPLITLADETAILHSHLLSGNQIAVHFERPNDHGFDEARCILPTYEWLYVRGFSPEEVVFFKKWMTHHQKVLFQYAERGGFRSIELSSGSPDSPINNSEDDEETLYSYITLADETKILHSHLLSGDRVEVHFKRANDCNFDEACCVLPTYEWLYIKGFSMEEIELFREIVEHNAHLIYRYAESGGLRFR